MSFLYDNTTWVWENIGDFLWTVFLVTGNGEENTYTDKHREKWRAAITHKGKRDSCEWDNIEIHSNIDTCLDEYEERDAKCCVLSKWILDGSGNQESTIDDRHVYHDENERSNESELFSDNREDEVSLNFWKVTKLLNRLSKPKTEEPSTPYSDESLLCLIVLTIRIGLGDKFFVIANKIVHTLGDIIERICIFPSRFSEMDLPQKIDAPCTYEADKKWHPDKATASSTNKVESDKDGSKNKDRSKVWLQGKQEKYNSNNSKVRDKSLWKIVHDMSLLLHVVSKIENNTYLHKFYWLERGESRNIEPTTSTIVDFSHEEHCYEEYEIDEKKIACVFFEEFVRGLREDNQRKNTNDHIHEVTWEVEVIIACIQFSECDHSLCYCIGGIDAYGTHHDESKYYESQNEKDERGVNVFLFHENR